MGVCDIKPDDAKDRCGRPATVIICGGWRCRLHLPTPDPNCTHSLASGGRCSYCGGAV